LKSFGRDQVLKALQRLGELADQESVQLNICIYGGCAMMLAYDRKRITRDNDAVFYPAENVQPLIKQVAEEQGLPVDWLNDDVRQFLATQEAKRTLPIELPGLQVTIPTAGYLLAMKALACRRALPGYKGDEADLRFLIRKLGISTFDEIQEWIDKFYPDDVPSAGDRAFLEQLIREEAT
jgi:hypothetical protein